MQELTAKEVADIILRLKKLQNSNDEEHVHRFADNILCDILKKLGYEKIVEEYEEVPKWFA